jgi:hypothetical protein
MMNVMKDFTVRKLIIDVQLSKSPSFFSGGEDEID